MPSRKPTDDLPDETPLSARELKRLREMLIDDDRATWARKRIAVFIPWFVAVVGGLYGLYETVGKHFKP